MKWPNLAPGGQPLVLFVLLFALPAGGQKKLAPTKSQGVLHVITQLVQVNVIVNDKHGQPIPDLTREEPPAAPAGKKALDAAALSPLDATAVACVVKPVAIKTPPGQPASVEMQYWIDARDITLTPVGDGWQASITLAIVELGSKGESLKGLSHQIDFHLSPDKLKNFLGSGLRFNEPLAIVPAAERIRVVVRDDSTGSLGSLSVPLDRVLPPGGG